MLVMAAVCTGFAACSSDDGDVNYKHSQTPETEAQGTYWGTFTRLQSNDPNATPESGEGTLVIMGTDTAYLAHVQTSCESLNINVEKSVNISYANAGFILSTIESDSQMRGSIEEDGQISMKFNLKIRVGRSTRPYAITFVGTKTGVAQE